MLRLMILLIAATLLVACGGSKKSGSLCNSPADCPGGTCVESQCVALQKCAANDSCAEGTCNNGVCWTQSCDSATACPYGSCQNGTCIGQVTNKPGETVPYVCDFSSNTDNPGCIEYIGSMYTSEEGKPIITDDCQKAGGTLVANGSCSNEGRIGICNWLPGSNLSYLNSIYGDPNTDLSRLKAACNAAGDGDNWIDP